MRVPASLVSFLLGLPLSGCAPGNDGACSDMTDCDSSLSVTTSFGVAPDGRIDATALEVWPERPASRPLTAAEIADGCALLATCPLSSAEAGLSTCASINPYEERAIPFGSTFFFATAAASFMNGGRNASESWAFFLRDVLDRDSCEGVSSLLTARPGEITCTEAGCWWYSTDREIPSVTCDGSVATLTTSGFSYRRDCARTYLDCDPSSPTGCTDRHPVACDPRAIERCDGEVRLGCDAYGRVTYRDCGWLEGGQCVESEQGATCVYPTLG